MKNLVTTQMEEQAAVRVLAGRNSKIAPMAKSAKIERETLYLRRSLSGLSGIQKLIKPEDTEKEGIRNIDSARLSGGTAFIVTGIVISTAASAAKLANENEITAQEFTIGSGNNAAFHNSELVIKVANGQKFKSLLRHISPEDSGDNSFFNSAHSVSPFVIAESQTISAELNIFDPVAADKDVVIEVAFVGYRLTQNA